MKTQLKFSDDFNKIIDDIPIWKNENDIDLDVINFIKNTSDNRIIYEIDTDKYRCSKCLKVLDGFYCKKCNKQHIEKELGDKGVTTTIEEDIKDYTNFVDDIFYYVFDIVENYIILYLLKEEITYYNPITVGPYKNSSISILETYKVKKEGIINLKDNTYTSYVNMFNNVEKYENNLGESYVYLDNLEKLKNTIYKYSFIWECKDYLKLYCDISLATLTLLPLYIKEFEYLVKYKLYALAFTSKGKIKKGKNFKEIFGIDRKYLPFMVENNIDIEQLRALKLSPTFDMEEVKNIAFRLYPYKYLINDINLKYKDIRNYLKSLNLNYDDYFYEYYDYIRMAKDFGYDMKDKKILFPKDLIEAHDRLYLQTEVINDPNIDLKIKEIAALASINNYDDGKYVIFPADSIKSLIEESRQQKNCVRTYSKLIIEGECQIYFMREKSNINKSLVTIEVVEDRIVQARVKFNEQPSEELKKILDIWQINLVVIKKN